MKLNDSLRGFILHRGLFLFAEKMASSDLALVNIHKFVPLFCIIILSGYRPPLPQHWYSYTGMYVLQLIFAEEEKQAVL